jgi:DNA repair protein RadC
LSQKVWYHPGGKLREVGPESLANAELLAILISSGVKDKPAGEVADEILARFGSFKGMANQPLTKLMEIKGLGEVKAIRIAAAFEIARRIVNEVLKESEKTQSRTG